MLHKNGVRPVVAVVGIDIGKNNFHIVAHDKDTSNNNRYVGVGRLGLIA